MRLSRSGAFVGGVVFTVVIGGGTAVAAGGTDVLFGHGNVGKATTGLANTKGTPLSLVAKKGAPPLKVSNTVKVKNLDSDLLDGKDSKSFLASTGKAADSALLGGQPATAFLGAGATAADSAKLGGQPASNYLSTVYAATTTLDQPSVPLVPPTQIDKLTLPPGTWSLSLTAYFENTDTLVGEFGCLPLVGTAPTQTYLAGATVDVLAAGPSRLKTHATLSSGIVISVTKSTPVDIICVTVSPDTGNITAEGKVLASNLTATRVTDPQGSVTVVN